MPFGLLLRRATDFCTVALLPIFVQPDPLVRGCAFLTRQKGTKKRPKGLPLWEPLYGKGLCGPYPQWRQAAVMVRPTGHVPPANAAKQEGRKYVWRHLPLPSVVVPEGSTLQASCTNRLAASPSG